MFIDEIKKLSTNKKVYIFCDMDGVIAEFGASEKDLILNNAKNLFLNKRPIFTTINKLKEFSQIQNVEICIMSNCHFKEQKEEKIKWLKKYCPFIKTQNINIIVLKEENYTKETKDYLKIHRIKSILKENNCHYFLLEDNHDIIKSTNKIAPMTGRHFSEILD